MRVGHLNLSANTKGFQNMPIPKKLTRKLEKIGKIIESLPYDHDGQPFADALKERMTNHHENLARRWQSGEFTGR